MIAKKSVFDLNEFVVIRNNYEFIPPEEDNLLINETLSNYEIDVDYSIVPNDTETAFQIFVKIQVNKDGILPGYKLFSEGVGLFEFVTPNLSDDEKSVFLIGSGISICINSLRSLISGVTSFGPFGKYLLPSIDVSDLVAQKTANIQARKKVKTKK